MEFILGKKPRGDSPKGCVFCRMVREKKDKKNLVLARKNSCFVVLNKYPYNNGHLMVVPRRHLSEITGLRNDEMLEVTQTIQEAVVRLKKTLHPDGFNIGINQGRLAGAGIADHIHFHIVPRWEADTNFMPVLASTKQMPQHIKESYDLLAREWRGRR